MSNNNNNQFDLDVRITTTEKTTQATQPNILTFGTTCGSCGTGFPCYYSIVWCFPDPTAGCDLTFECV